MKLIVTPGQAAEQLCTSPNEVYRLLETGELKAYKQGTAWKIPQPCLEEYVIAKANAEAKERRKKCQES